MPTHFASPYDLKGAVGAKLGYSDWLEVTQERIDHFADATDDHQWIHVDPERAAKGPFGTTIAHGYLTLSLVSALLPRLFEVDQVSMSINYGTNRVRFPSPVAVGSRGPRLIGDRGRRGRSRWRSSDLSHHYRTRGWRKALLCS